MTRIERCKRRSSLQAIAVKFGGRVLSGREQKQKDEYGSTVRHGTVWAFRVAFPDAESRAGFRVEAHTVMLDAHSKDRRSTLFTFENDPLKARRVSRAVRAICMS